MVSSTTRSRVALVGGGVAGIGLAAVLDVIVFHLVFQTHHLFSSIYTQETLAGLQQNSYYDGLFVLGMLGVMFCGVGLLWWAVNRSSHRLSTLAVGGAVLVGMGVFNVFDGIVDHYVLGIHDAVHGTSVWNPPWILVSLVLLAAGGGLLQLNRRCAATIQPQNRH